MNKAPSSRPSPFDAIEAEFVGGLGVGSDPTGLALASAEVAFAGRSNVGKSSLINTLVSRKGLVRTSSTPGCTRQINFFSVRCRDDARMTFVDLPGYGFAKRSKAERAEWAGLIEGYLSRRPALRLVVILVDARRGIEEEDRDLCEFLASGRKAPLEPVPVLIVATKEDKLQKSRAAAAVAALRKEAGLPVVAFSTVSKTGYAELWLAIRRTLRVLGEPAEKV